MFGNKNATPIGQSLAGTQAARYAQRTHSPLVVKEKTSATHNGARADKGVEVSNGQDVVNDTRSSNRADDPQVVSMMEKVMPRVLDRIDAREAAQLDQEELREELRPVVMEVMGEVKMTLNQRELERLETLLVDEFLGFGPLEDLLADPGVSDIMVNGAHQVYVERDGKLQLTNIKFRDEHHVQHIAQRICTRVGRRIDQTTPVADARLEDGSRVNVIMPPLALRGTSISIRKFAVKPITLESMAHKGGMSKVMAQFLCLSSMARLNIVISGGTGSGKTTMLNALSKMIDHGERAVTIEDAAELQLQQPHVVSLETRPSNLEGQGAYTMRDLLINALRMRPDRIILGEVRGPECLDMLQAMNTGHEGSMCTLHANSPREALTRMENMVSMGGVNFPLRAIRQQIVDAVDIIVQIRRMRDGSRKVTSITEIAGMEDETILCQELFRFDYGDALVDGRVVGEFSQSLLRPHCEDKFRQNGLEREMKELLG